MVIVYKGEKQQVQGLVIIAEYFCSNNTNCSKLMLQGKLICSKFLIEKLTKSEKLVKEKEWTSCQTNSPSHGLSMTQLWLPHIMGDLRTWDFIYDIGFQKNIW